MNAEQDNKEAGNAGVSVCNAIDDSPGVREIIRKSYHELDSKCKRAKTLVQVSKELLSVNQRKNKYIYKPLSLQICFT